MQYPLLKMENAVPFCAVRQEVFEKLKIAQNNLPQGYALRIWDGWRPFSLQRELYEKYSPEEKNMRSSQIIDAINSTKAEMLLKISNKYL
jgi:D-alanyl-D-alanine dipeptidase